MLSQWIGILLQRILRRQVYEQPYVFQAVVKDWKYSDYVTEPYIVKVWAVNTLGESLGELTREKLKKELMSKAIADVTVHVLEVESVDFNIDVDVCIISR